MIILTNCLSDVVDEGCLKVANSLIKRIKKVKKETTIITYDKKTELSDMHIPINKFMINLKLAGFVWKKQEPVLYIPFSSKIIPMVIRLTILSLFCRKGLTVIRSIQSPMGWCSKVLLRISGVRVVALSHSAWEYYHGILGERACYLKAGVDTNRFMPVNHSEKELLRKKYGLPLDKVIVLHVGHLNTGRNVGKLMELGDRFHAVLVVSTLTAFAQDENLREQLLQKGNITLIDSYLPDIQEIYQLSDVYLFPVLDYGRCIDSPLSAMEAAACNLPVVTTSFGELKELIGCDGFYKIDSFEPDRLNELLLRAYREGKHPRESILVYDWDKSVKQLLNWVAPENNQ